MTNASWVHCNTERLNLPAGEFEGMIHARPEAGGNAHHRTLGWDAVKKAGRWVRSDKWDDLDADFPIDGGNP